MYDWAGELRKIDIAKGNMFCNALHPFREGNGRSQREFIRCLALHNGYVINFANVGKDEMLEASRESFLCEYGAMERLFRKCLRKR